METILKKHIADENWEAIHYLYEEAPEELRLKFAYPFGRAYLQSRLKNGISTNTEVEQLSEAFRISLYDYRMIKTIWAISGSDLINLIERLEKKAMYHIEKSGNGELNSADHSKYGSEYYLLIFYLYSDRQLAIRRTSKAAVFLLEAFVAVHVNNTCENESTWESLLDTLTRTKVLNPRFMDAIIAFLRLYNAFKSPEKLTQLSFMLFLLTHKEKFLEQEIDKMNDFVSELQAESLLVLLQALSGEGADEKKSENDRITRAEDLKQFAIDTADCPEDLDHSYFTETKVYKKVVEFLDSSRPEEAFKIFQKAFPEGLPENAALIRPLFTRTVTELFAENGQIDYVVKALELDPSNQELNELLMN